MNRGFRLPRAKPGAQIEDLGHGPLPRLGDEFKVEGKTVAIADAGGGEFSENRGPNLIEQAGYEEAALIVISNVRERVSAKQTPVHKGLEWKAALPASAADQWRQRARPQPCWPADRRKD